MSVNQGIATSVPEKVEEVRVGGVHVSYKFVRLQNSCNKIGILQTKLKYDLMLSKWTLNLTGVKDWGSTVALCLYIFQTT